MAISGTTPITAPVAPTSAGDTYASHIAEYGKGGYQSVADTTARNAITTDRRTAGMCVYCRTEGLAYILGTGLTNSDWSGVSLTATGFAPFYKDILTDMKAITSSQFNRMCILKGELSAFDGSGGVYIAVLDPSASVVDNPLTDVVPTDQGSAATADKHYWKKLV